MGRLIVIDGLDGSGKGTHSKLVTDKLNELGIPAMRISFPDFPQCTCFQVFNPAITQWYFCLYLSFLCWILVFLLSFI